MKFLFFSLVLFYISFSSHSQNLNTALANFVPPSPSAAALGKFGDIPVSYSTGIPSITIPIYHFEDKANGLGLNISLDYHAGGIRVGEKASNVGIGWALNAGGVINREVRGGPDEGMPGTTGYWAAPALPNITDYRNNSNLYGTNISPSNPYFTYYKSQVDAEPDVFSFNFNGHSGRFIIGKNNQVYIWPQQQLNISKTGGLGGLSFTIIAEDGMNYVFDQQETTQRTTVSGTSFDVGSSWYLSKIISPFSISEIDFSYQTVPTNYQTKTSQTWYKSMSGILTASSESGLSSQSFSNFSSKQIAQISISNNIKVNFIYDNYQRCDVPGDYALSKIEITDGINIKGFRMDHDYSFSSWSGSPVTSCSGIDEKGARLVLHQVTEYSGALTKPPYIIEYNNSVALPSTFSYAQDHWGFFNGAYNNSSLLPLDGGVDMVNYSSTGGPDNADRRTNPAYALAGSISRLTYPTGGSTTFTFESNDVPDDGSVTYISQPASAVINGTDPSKRTFFTLSTNKSVTTFQFAFGGFSSANSSCSITANIVSIDESTIYASVILGPGIGYSKSFDATIPPGQYKYKYYFGTQCVPELFVVNLQWNNWAPAPQALKDYIGGLRIKKIEDRTGINDPSIMTKEYTYLLADNQNSSGSVAVRPTYSYPYNEFCTVPDGQPCPDCSQINATYNVLMSTSLFTLASALGSPVQYSRVEEKFTGDGSGNIGRIVRYFNSTATNGFPLPYVASNPGFVGLPYITPETPEWIYGLLSDDSTYDKDNNIKHSTHNEYSLPATSLDNSIRENFKGIKVFVSKTSYVCLAVSDISYLLDDYFPYTGRSELVRSVETTYGDNGNALSTTSDYLYDPTYFNTKKVTTTDSKGVVYEKRIYYPYDVTGGISAEMAANHIYSVPVTTEKWKINIDTTQNQLVADEVTEYGKFNNNALIKPASIDYLNTSLPINVSVIGNFNPTSLVRNSNYIQREVQLVNYDSKGNVVQQVGRNGINESYMWGYNQSLPIAKVMNASNTLVQSYSEIANSGTLTVPPSLNGTASVAINTYYTGSINLTISFVGPPSANAVGRISYSVGTAYTGGLCVSSGSSSLCSGYSNTVTIPNLPAGVYSLAIVTNVNSNTAPGSSVVVTYNYQDRQAVSTGIREFFYENFEENANATAINKYSGDKSYAGSFQVPYVMPNTRKYLIDYQFYNGSRWQYIRKKFVNNMILSDGTFIDEVRVYPADGEITTFTYEPLLGISSITDINGKTTFYEYDGLQRLIRIRDQDYNILKQYEYQYQVPVSCGANCSILPMQNLAGNNTLGYPVGVFNVSGKLLGNATNQSQYLSLWNADTADTHRGTLSAGVDSMHFQLAAVAGQTLPASVTGCRYYQFDLPWTLLDGIWNNNAAYVTFGDGTGMYMGKTYSDTTMILPANTTLYHLADAFDNAYYIEHTYPDMTLKTLTFYQNDGTESSYLDNAHSPAVSLSKLTNLRGNLPQRMTVLGGSSYQQAGASTVASITNWSSIQSITSFNPHSGDAGVTPTTHMSYAQDFMANNQNLQTISTSGGGYYQAYYRDTTFKISRLKSDWNTYFSNLQTLLISDEHWSRENLTGLTKLTSFRLVAATQLHSNVITGNAPISIPASVLDNIIIQIAAGAGQSVTNGSITLITGGTTRTTASDSAVTFLQSKGWVITLTY